MCSINVVQRRKKNQLNCLFFWLLSTLVKKENMNEEKSKIYNKNRNHKSPSRTLPVEKSEKKKMIETKHTHAHTYILKQHFLPVPFHTYAAFSTQSKLLCKIVKKFFVVIETSVFHFVCKFSFFFHLSAFCFSWKNVKKITVILT